MIVVLTICSANYLAQAKTLGDSLRAHNPDYHFVIGLVDRYPASLDPTYCHPHEVLPVENLSIPEFQDMRRRYDIVELNTAVKPFFMEHLYQRDPRVQAVIYLDPDILVVSDLAPLAESLQRYNIILTPHCSGFHQDDASIGYEIGMLRTGIYNLGFIGTSRGPDTLTFLAWWKKRLVQHCQYRPSQGLFVDQLWTNLAPLYFQHVLVEKNPGYNMCYWNLGERTLSRQDNVYRVNGESDLLFYHFSSYDPGKPEFVSNRRPPVLLADHPELAPLFADYADRLKQNDYATVSAVECCFYPKPPAPPPPTIRDVCKGHLKHLTGTILQALPQPVRSYCRRAGQFVADNTAGKVPAPSVEIRKRS